MYVFQNASVKVVFGDASMGIDADYYSTLFSSPAKGAIDCLTGYARATFDKEIVFVAQQVHGAVSLSVTSSLYHYYGIIPQTADCLVTNIRSFPLALFTADCVPLVLFDSVRCAVAVIHVGWRGFVAGVVAQGLNRMLVEFCADPTNISVFIGPSAGACCYEVSQEFVDIVCAAYPEFLFKDRIFTYRSGTIFCDLRLAITEQLLFCGILKSSINHVFDCTICNISYYSHRRQKIFAGRQITAVMLK